MSGKDYLMVFDYHDDIITVDFRRKAKFCVFLSNKNTSIKQLGNKTFTSEKNREKPHSFNNG